MRTRLERALDARDDLIAFREKYDYGWRRLPSGRRRRDRRERRLNRKVERLGGTAEWSRLDLGYDESGDHR